MNRQNQRKGSLRVPRVLTATFAIMLLIVTLSPANSVEDDYGVTWTATREYNIYSSGYDIMVTADTSPVSVYWVTSDTGGDEAPWIAIDPDTGYPVVAWSKTVIGGDRIRISWFDGSGFDSPQAVTSGGTCFGDRTPNMVVESDGDIHLVFYRDHVSSNGEAVYMKYSGSWSTPAVYSLTGDDVIGSCIIKLLDESQGILEADYHYDESYQRTRCKNGESNPWASCQ